MIQPRLDHLETLDRSPRISGDPFHVGMGSGRGEKRPPQICREPAHIRGQIAGTADISFPICHLYVVLEFACDHHKSSLKEDFLEFFTFQMAQPTSEAGR